MTSNTSESRKKKKKMVAALVETDHVARAATYLHMVLYGHTEAGKRSIYLLELAYNALVYEAQADIPTDRKQIDKDFREWIQARGKKHDG